LADRSKIEWTDASLNPIRARRWVIQNDGSGKERIGWHCEHVSEGCRHCYAEAINRRLGTGLDYKPGHLYRAEREGYANGEAKLFLDEAVLAQIERWKRPRKIFVGSMTDLFGAFVPTSFIDRIMAEAVLHPRHVLQVLTKRPEQACAYMKAPGRRQAIVQHLPGVDPADIPWPLPNVWIGTSVESRDVQARLDHLRATPAALRWCSFEPLLGRIGHEAIEDLDWAVIGGESGLHARDHDLDEAIDLVDALLDQGTAVYVKQLGSRPVMGGRRWRVDDAKGGGKDLAQWPVQLRVRQFPEARRG